MRQGTLHHPLLLRLLVGLALIALAFLLDRHAYGLLRTVLWYEQVGELREGLTAAKFLGSGLGTLLAVLIVAGLDRAGRRRAGVLVLVVFLAAAAAGALKVVTGRERPSHLDQLPGEERCAFHGPVRGLREAPFQSFPSGHVTAATASATCLATFYPAARIIFYGVAVATGINRVVKHQHFLSDVTTGGLIGHLLALWLLHLPALRRRWQDPLAKAAELGTT